MPLYVDVFYYKARQQHTKLAQELADAQQAHRDDVRLTKVDNEEMALKLVHMKEMQMSMLQVRSELR